MAEPQQQPRKSILDLERLSLFTPTPGAEGKRARLTFGIRDGYPRISVFTNDPNHSDGRGVLSAPMDGHTFYVFLDSLEEVIKHQGEVKHKIDCLTGIRNQEGRVIDKKLQSELWYGKDAEGHIWMSVLVSGAPKIVFKFNIYEYHFLYKPDGTKLTEAEASALAAKAMVRLLRDVFGSLLSKAYEEQALAKVAAKANGTGNGGYNKNSYAKGSNGSSIPASGDPFDDISM